MEKKNEEEEQKKGWGKAAKVSLGVLGGLGLLMGYISTSGMKEPELEEAERASRNPIDLFIAGLNARNLELVRAVLHYPHIQINGNNVAILNGPESFRIDFQSLTGAGWAYSTIDSCTTRHYSWDKFHYELQISMHQASGYRYATHPALWIVTMKDDIWGIQCCSHFPDGLPFS